MARGPRPLLPSRRVKGGNAAAGPPAVRLDPGSFEHVAEPPTQKAAPGQCRAAPPIEAGPRHKRAAPTIGPNLDPNRAAGTWAARIDRKSTRLNSSHRT